jgi:hypothetical protein
MHAFATTGPVSSETTISRRVMLALLGWFLTECHAQQIVRSFQLCDALFCAIHRSG